MTAPHDTPDALPEWTHPTNPREARRAADGRIALRITVRGDRFEPDAIDRWIYIDTPNGMVMVTILTDEEVADWTPLELP